MITTFYVKNKKQNQTMDIFDLWTSMNKEQETHLSFSKTKSVVRDPGPVVLYTNRLIQTLANIGESTGQKRIKTTLIDQFDNLTEEQRSYQSFRIPKRKGGFREILAPADGIKNLQQSLVYLLQDFGLVHNNIAHAYINKRSITTNSGVHKNSNHFANLDLKDFFPSITLEVIKESFLKQNLLYVINHHAQSAHPDYFAGVLDNLFEAIEKIALYNGSTPQGAVSSPFISNIVMVPFDYELEKLVKKRFKQSQVTRYADDITISSKFKLADTKEEAIKIVENLVETALQKAFSKPYFQINKAKTSISSKNGINRVTGIKINQENKLSIGYKEKRMLKRDLANLTIQKLNNQIDDDFEERLQGTIGYWSFLNSVEPGYAKHILRVMERKFKINKPLLTFLSR